MPVPSKGDLKQLVLTQFKKKDAQCISIFGMKAKYGGGVSTGFCLLYDNVEAVKKFEPKHRQIRSGLKEKPDAVVGRKQRKEKKNREKKFRGTRKEKRVRAAKA